VNRLPNLLKGPEMHTSIESFSLTGGYPDEKSVAALYDTLDFQRAVQAYIWATPAVEMEVMTDGIERDLGLSLTTLGIFENFLDAKTVVATGNGQSIYALGNIDMSKTGPVVIEAPPAVLGFMMSGWQQPLADIGPLGPDKGKGGSFVVLPPGRRAGSRRLLRRALGHLSLQLVGARVCQGGQGRAGSSGDQRDAHLSAGGQGEPAGDEVRERLRQEGGAAPGR
jgi:hypothetical protein